jgi:hypothetical protein
VWSELGSDGKRRKRNKSFDREKDAKAFRSTIELDAENKGVGDPAKRTTIAYLKAWIDRLDKRSERSPSTLDSYRHYLTMITPISAGLASAVAVISAAHTSFVQALRVPAGIRPPLRAVLSGGGKIAGKPRARSGAAGRLVRACPKPPLGRPRCRFGSDVPRQIPLW